MNAYTFLHNFYTHNHVFALLYICLCSSILMHLATILVCLFLTSLNVFELGLWIRKIVALYDDVTIQELKSLSACDVMFGNDAICLAP